MYRDIGKSYLELSINTRCIIESDHWFVYMPILYLSSTSRQPLLNKILIHIQILHHMVKLLQATVLIIHVCLGLFCEQSRVVLAGNEHAVTNIKFLRNSNDLSAAESILEMLAWDHVGSFGNGVDDLAIDIVLKAVVEACIAAGCTAAVGYTGGVGE